MSIEAGEFAPPLAALMAEQERVQAGKDQKRLLRQYNFYTLQTSMAVSSFLVEKGDASDPSIPGLLHGMSESKVHGEKVHWVDMCGGMGLALREFANLRYAQDHVETTNVDLFDYPLSKLKRSEQDALEMISPGMMQDHTKPQLIQADAETITLPKPADLITAIEGIQYMNNPLACIVNWYNQLQSDGLMVIAAEHEWAGDIRYTGEPFPSKRQQRVAPTAHLLHELAKHGIAYAINENPDWQDDSSPYKPDSFHMLAIQRRPGTSLSLKATIDKIHNDIWGYKTVYYEKQTSPLVEVTHAAAQA